MVTERNQKNLVASMLWCIQKWNYVIHMKLGLPWGLTE